MTRTPLRFKVLLLPVACLVVLISFQSVDCYLVPEQHSVRHAVKTLVRRQLSSFPTCPEGCHVDGCISDSTTGGLRCNKCVNNLIVLRASGQCGVYHESTLWS